METKFSNSYIANVSDSEKKKTTYISRNENGEEVENFYYNKTYKNHGKILFCSCGNNFQIDLKLTELSPASFEKIICESCKKEYSDFTNVNELSSIHNDNVVSIRYRTFERENKIKLVKFTIYANVNNKTKKLFFKKETDSIVYNKLTNRFYKIKTIKGKKIITSIGIRNAFYKFEDVIHIYDDVRKIGCNYHNQNVIKDNFNDFVNPLNLFLEKILEQVDKRDYLRILKHIESGFVELKNTETNTEFNVISFGENTIEKKDNKLKYTKYLSIVSSILIIPKLANVLFVKGNDFFLDLITIESLPTPSEIKKNKLTNPKNIIDTIVKQSSINYNKYRNIFTNQTSFIDDDFNIKTLTEEELEKQKKEIKEEKKKIKIKNQKIKKFNLNNNLYNIINDKKDLDALFYIISSNLEYEDLYYLIDYYGAEKTFKIFKLLFGHSFINSKDYNYEILKHIFKIFIQDIPALKAFSKTTPTIERHRFFNFFDTYFYFDTHRMCKDLNLDISEILNLKTWNEVVDLHDNYMSLIDLMKMEKFQKGIQEFSKYYKNIKTIKIDNIQYTLIDDVLSLEKESKEMHHCVKSYAQGLSTGRHLIFSVENVVTNERGTLEFKNLIFRQNNLKDDTSSQYIYRNSIWDFSQLKGKYNKKVTSEMIETTYKFFERLKEEKLKIEIKELNNYDLRIEDNNQILIDELPLDELPF